jgi:RNA polymerase sigma-70 factor (family 1)
MQAFFFIFEKYMFGKTPDTTLFNRVFEQYFTALCYFAETYTKNREDAKDIVIASYHKYWDKRNDFSNPVQIKSFLYLVTRNACVDLFRKNKHQANAFLPEIEISSIEDDAHAERLGIEAEMLRKIYEEAAKLPDKCRSVFELTYFEGLNTKQVAEKLGMTASNVTSQRARAIKLLRIALDNHSFFIAFLAVASIRE